LSKKPALISENFYDPQLPKKTNYFDTLVTNIRICYGNNHFITDTLKLRCEYVKFLNSGWIGNTYLAKCDNNIDVAVKFNKIQPIQVFYRPLTRDINGMQLDDKFASENSKRWIPKYLDTVAPPRGSLFNINTSEYLVYPGLVMEYLLEFKPPIVTGAVAPVIDGDLLFCKYFIPLQLMLDLYVDCLIHEDLHDGNVMVVRSANDSIINHGNSKINCPIIKCVDSGAINTLDGSKFSQHHNHGFTKNQREVNPNAYFITYLTHFHKYKKNSETFILSEEQKLVTNSVLHEIFKKIGTPETVRQLTRSAADPDVKPAAETRAAATTGKTMKGGLGEKDFQAAVEGKRLARQAAQAESRSAKTEELRGKTKENSFYLNYMEYMELYMNEGIENQPSLNKITINY
jgi:hypothetical protein